MKRKINLLLSAIISLCLLTSYDYINTNQTLQSYTESTNEQNYILYNDELPDHKA